MALLDIAHPCRALNILVDGPEIDRGIGRENLAQIVEVSRVDPPPRCPRTPADWELCSSAGAVRLS
jgi:hypothetical protein